MILGAVQMPKAILASTVLLAAIAAGVAAGQGPNLFKVKREAARVVPEPALDARPGHASLQTAVLAGGCFWGVQGVFQHTKGVVGAVSGYAGGERRTAQYDLVGTGSTGHAEAVQVTFDPALISYGRLLQIYFSVAHDPTQKNRQGPDVGPQYRSAIFPTDAEQAEIAQTYIAQLDRAQAFDAAIATTIERDRMFYPAETYHQDYMVRHPRDPYILMHDLPKVADLKRLFPDRHRPEPILVRASN
jgi:peptide-methionine (S)-S-oxide reductase